MKRYRTIVADPPWPYSGKGLSGLGLSDRSKPIQWSDTRHVGGRYEPMSMDAIHAVQPPVETDAHLYLWTTNAFMREAHDVAKAWGFQTKTILTWMKAQPDGRPSMRSGYYFRGATEHCLFGVRGSLPLHTDEALPTAYLWPRLPHSVKPDAFYDLVEQVSPGPYLELFARRARFNWDYWGDESLGTAEMPAA